MCSCHSIIECYGLFSGVEYKIALFYFIVQVRLKSRSLVSDNNNE